MYKKIMMNISVPEYDIENAIASLRVMIDFIALVL
jgi:hypothetical protein